MGADMIVSVVAVPRGTQPNYDAGYDVIRSLQLDLDTLEELYNESVIDEDEQATNANGEVLTDNKGQPIWDAEKVRATLRKKLDEFKDEINSREVAWISVRDLDLAIGGGLSWGDDTDFGYACTAVGAVPGLLSAMGFVNWWEEKD